MIILHKGNRIGNGEEVIGYVTKMWGQYHIILENDENTAYPVDEESIIPCFDNCNISNKVLNKDATIFILFKKLIHLLNKLERY